MPRAPHVQAHEVLSLDDVITKLATQTGMFKSDVRRVVVALRDLILDEVAKGNAVRLYRLGIFVPRPRYMTEKTSDGKKRFVLDKSKLGLVFYPSTPAATLKAKTDVEQLINTPYTGFKHNYVF